MNGNPFMGNFWSSDGGTINLCILTPGPHIRDTFTHLGIPEAADDPRFSDVHALLRNWQAASELVVKAIAGKPFAFTGPAAKLLGTPQKFAQHGASGAWVLADSSVRPGRSYLGVIPIGKTNS